jgi:hypothetical protein
VSEREALFAEADRLVEEAQAIAAAKVHADLGAPPISKWPANTAVSPITGALGCNGETVMGDRASPCQSGRSR